MGWGRSSQAHLCNGNFGQLFAKPADQFIQLLIGAILLSACHSLTNAMGFDQKSFDFANSEIDQVTYRFTDSSVPPRFHRSYGIVVTAQAVRITVDSYGDILAQQEWPSSAEQFQTVLTVLNEARIRQGEKSMEPGCTGGTSDRIIAHRQGESIFDAYRYNCGGDSGPMEGDIATVKKHLQGLIPNFSSLRS